MKELAKPAPSFFSIRPMFFLFFVFHYKQTGLLVSSNSEISLLDDFTKQRQITRTNLQSQKGKR